MEREGTDEVRQTFSTQVSQRLTSCCMVMHVLMSSTGCPTPFSDEQA